jgi:O-antigen/teichoic acid export membrane protein
MRAELVRSSASVDAILLRTPSVALQAGQRIIQVNQMIRSPKVRPVRSRGGWALATLRDPLYYSSYALLVNSIGTTAVGIAYWAIAAHFYSQQALGRSAALVSALMFLSILAQLNLPNALPRFIPSAGRSAGKFIACCYGASSCAGLISGLACVIVLPRLSSQWQFIRNSLPLAVVFVAAAVVWQVFTLQDVALLSIRRPVLVPVENFVYGVAKLLMLVGVFSLLPSTGIFFSWVVSLAVTVPAVNWLIFRRYLRDRDYAAVPGGLRAREVVRFVSVDYIGSVLAQAYGSLLPLLVLSILGATANSSFYIAWTITAGLGLIASNFGLSLLIEGAAAPHRLADLTRGILARCLAITSLGAIVLILAAHPILEIYGSGYATHAASLLGLLAVGTIPSCMVIVAISLDRIAGRVGRATLTRFILTAFVLGGSWMLVRKIGIDGVAFAWGGANLIVALARFPTIARAARRQTTTSPKPILLPRRPVPTHTRPGIHRRPAAGRHRAGVPRTDRAERLGHLPPSPAPPPVRAPTMSAALDPTEQTAKALQLLMSLGSEVGFPPQHRPSP